MEGINFIIENWEALFSAVTSVVGAFAIVATLTPNQTDNELVDKVMKFINFFGANFGKAANKED
jgi:hypothetical protein|tara:strand:+ start:590 stop:781 length:192 start_codon:yes stop_codon:yes gene_type:complete